MVLTDCHLFFLLMTMEGGELFTGALSAPEKTPLSAREAGGIWRVWSFLLNLLDNAIFGL